MIKAIIFGFNGIVVNKFMEESAADFCKKFKVHRKDFNVALRYAMIGFDMTQSNENTFFAKLIQELDLAIDPSNVRHFFEQADYKHVKTHKGVAELIQKLKKHHIVGVATN